MGDRHIAEAVFLDRDGTIAQDVPYCSRPEDFELLPGAAEAVGKLNALGLKVILATNQSGLARGYFTSPDLERVHGKLRTELARAGAWLDAIFYCPHHPDDGCECRKPKPGLLLRSARLLGIDLAMSYMVGDSPADVAAGRSAGCTTVLLSPRCTDPPDVSADHVSSDLSDAVAWISVRNISRSQP